MNCWKYRLSMYDYWPNTPEELRKMTDDLKHNGGYIAKGSPHPERLFRSFTDAQDVVVVAAIPHSVADCWIFYLNKPCIVPQGCVCLGNFEYNPETGDEQEIVWGKKQEEGKR